MPSNKFYPTRGAVLRTPGAIMGIFTIPANGPAEMALFRDCMMPALQGAPGYGPGSGSTSCTQAFTKQSTKARDRHAPDMNHETHGEQGASRTSPRGQPQFSGDIMNLRKRPFNQAGTIRTEMLASETSAPMNKELREFIQLLTRTKEPRDAAAIIKTSDGFGIPSLFAPEFLSALGYQSIARHWGAVVGNNESGSLNFSADVTINPAAIILETGSYAVSAETTSVPMDLVKLGGRYSMTEAVDEDTALDKYATFQQLAAAALAKAENTLFLTGSGSGEPKGIFEETATATTASDTAITFNELLEFDASIKAAWDTVESFDADPAGYRGPVYLMHPDTAEYIRKLNDGGSPAKYYFDQQEGRLRLLFGRPVIRDENCPTIAGGAKVIAAVNWQGYVIGQRTPLLTMKVGYDTDTHAANWDYAERIDGKLWNADALRLLAMHA